MLYLRKLSIKDSVDVFRMLKGVETVENSFTNPVKNMSYEEYKNWLYLQDDWNKGISLPKDYVKQTIYWLMCDDIPIGIGKIRHELTIESRKNGGNIGYAIAAEYRGKGYGRELLRLLIQKAKKMGISEIILTIDKGNDSSRVVAECNGAKLIEENEERWYFKL